VLARITAVLVVANVATGAAVRLSGSGLGCPDWPTCAHQRITPPLSLHPMIEFGNRMVVVVLVVACGATLGAALVRRPRRRDLTWLAGGLVAGVVAEAVVGAIVVTSKLNPYVVAGHFMLGMVVLADAVLLVLRADHGPGRGTALVDRRALVLARVFLVVVVAALVAGTGVTGSGPHAGGPGAKRIPMALVTMARIHAETVLTGGVILLALLYVLWRTDAPAKVQDRGRIVLAVMAAQGVIGYTQYFTHLPAVLVGVHVVGATVVVSAVLWLHHGLAAHTAELATEAKGTPGDTGRGRAAESGATVGVTHGAGGATA
jgi:cytochrome c oxidase assembly protein subunit 15